MYYHNSPTVRQIKAIKKAQAVDMKHHLADMRLTSRKYGQTLRLLESVRKQELYIENERSAGRLDDKQLASAVAVIKRNRAKATRQFDKLLPDFLTDDN